MAWNFPSSSNSKYSTSVISNSLIYWRLACLKANGKFLITRAILNIKENNIVAVEMLKGEFMPVWNIENWVVWLFKRSQDCEHCRFYPMNRDKTLRVDRQEADRYQNICTSAPKTSPRYCWIVRNVTINDAKDVVQEILVLHPPQWSPRVGPFAISDKSVYTDEKQCILCKHILQIQIQAHRTNTKTDSTPIWETSTSIKTVQEYCTNTNTNQPNQHKGKMWECGYWGLMQEN